MTTNDENGGGGTRRLGRGVRSLPPPSYPLRPSPLPFSLHVVTAQSHCQEATTARWRSDLATAVSPIVGQPTKHAFSYQCYAKLTNCGLCFVYSHNYSVSHFLNTWPTHHTCVYCKKKLPTQITCLVDCHMLPQFCAKTVVSHSFCDEKIVRHKCDNIWQKKMCQ